MKKRVGTPTPKTAPGARKTAPKAPRVVLPAGWERIPTGKIMRKGDKICWPCSGYNFEPVKGLDGCRVDAVDFVIRPSAKRPGARRAKGSRP